MHAITNQIVEVLTPLLLSLITLAVTFAIQWLRQKTKQSIVGESIALLTTLAATIVAHTAQVYVDARKRGDGEWTPQDAEEVKRKAVDDLKLMGSQAVAHLLSSGMTEDAAKRLLGQLIEAQVHELKVRTGGV